MTSGERKALLFLAGIAALGAGARLVTAPSHPPTAAERDALRGQLGAVDSARRPQDATSARPAARGGRRKRASAVPPQAPPVAPLVVDVDVADTAALAELPGIGPVLARRIVDDRLARGTFGSLAGLEQVRGVGHTLAARLAPRVTFSGMSRPTVGTRDSGLEPRVR